MKNFEFTCLVWIWVAWKRDMKVYEAKDLARHAFRYMRNLDKKIGMDTHGEYQLMKRIVQGMEKVGLQGGAPKASDELVERAKEVLVRLSTYIETGSLTEYVKGEFPRLWIDFWYVAKDQHAYHEPMLEYFYQGMKEKYLNHFEVFEEMGVPETKIDQFMDSQKFQSAYRRARDYVKARGRAKLAEAAMTEGSSTLLNAFLKDLNSEHSLDKFVDYGDQGAVEDKTPTNRKETRGKAKKIDDLSVEKPSDSPKYDPESDSEYNERRAQARESA